MTRKFLIVTALVAGVAATADAQICAGTAPFTAGNMRVGVGAEFPTGSKTYNGEFAWGHESGMFLGGAVARSSGNTNTDQTAMDFGANGGYEMRFESMPKLRFCPVANLGYQNGPDLGTIQQSAIHYSVGGAVGSVLPATDNVAIVPSAAVRFVGARVKAEQGGSSTTTSDSWMEARLAAGLVFNRAITVAPVVTIPLNQDGAESTFGVAVSYNFGRAGGVAQQGGRKKTSRRR